jgi:4-hydroxyproline epimerase
MAAHRHIEILDTHTGGEPTRLVLAGGPDLGAGPLSERLKRFRDRFDSFRSAVVNEPRGSDVMVGALLCPPHDPGCSAGVIFFNNVGYLGMCGHGTIGVAIALAHLGRMQPGCHRLETPVGIVAVTLEDACHAAIDNVPSRRKDKNVSVTVPGLGRITGDVAWGGNWFFLVEDHQEKIAPDHVERLTDVAWRIRKALAARGITGDGGAVIDHIELFGPPTLPGADSKNFVLCPGKAYDRSPCGTGTSAKLACLVADGKFGEGRLWRQESIIGSMFEGSVRIVQGEIVPRIRGSAYVTAHGTLYVQEDDPLAWGIRAIHFPETA